MKSVFNIFITLWMLVCYSDLWSLAPSSDLEPSGRVMHVKRLQEMKNRGI